MQKLIQQDRSSTCVCLTQRKTVHFRGWRG